MFCKFFVNHRNANARGGVVFIDAATLCHANSQGLDISGSHHLKCRSRTVGRINRWLPDDAESHAEKCPSSWNSAHCGSFSYSWYSLDLFEHLPVIRSDLLGSIQSVVGHRQLKRQHVICTNAQVHSSHVPETFESQATADH